LVGSGTEVDYGERGVFSLRTKETTSDEAGEFSLSGVGRGRLQLVADHERLGRSKPVFATGSTTVEEPVELVLGAHAVLQGTLDVVGEPGEVVTVTAQSRDAPFVAYGVEPNDKRVYRFDRLAAGEYMVSATTGSPVEGIVFQGRAVELTAGEVSTLNFEAKYGAHELLVRPGEDADGSGLIMVITASGAITGATLPELFAAVVERPAGFWAWNMVVAGSAARVRYVSQGLHTVCAAELPTSVTNVLDALEYIQLKGVSVRTRCQAVGVTGGSDVQTIELDWTERSERQ